MIRFWALDAGKLTVTRLVNRDDPRPALFGNVRLGIAHDAGMADISIVIYESAEGKLQHIVPGDHQFVRGLLNGAQRHLDIPDRANVLLVPDRAIVQHGDRFRIARMFLLVLEMLNKLVIADDKNLLDVRYPVYIVQQPLENCFPAHVQKRLGKLSVSGYIRVA